MDWSRLWDAIKETLWQLSAIIVVVGLFFFYILVYLITQSFSLSLIITMVLAIIITFCAMVYDNYND